MAGNVLFVTVDQWRGDCLSALGHPVVETPNLDRLAAGGTLFANHWAQSAPCAPSRACLYTGTYSMTNRVVANGTPLDDRFTNLAREVRAGGYDPVLVGYTDMSVDPRSVAPDDPRLFSYEGVLPGFESVVDFRAQTLQPWLGWLGELGYQVPDDPQAIFAADPGYPGAADHGPSWAPPVYRAEHSDTAYLTDALLGWLEGRPAAAPWFAHLSYLRPHPPYRVPAPYHDRYRARDVAPPVRARTPEEEPAHPLSDMARGVPGVRAPGDDELRQITATYYGMMAEVDHHVGRLLDWLEGSGAAEDTLVVLTSDHGDQMGAHWLMEKLGWWDESYHVPLIVVDPRVPVEARGRRVDAFTEHVDVMPTVLAWLGMPVPRQCDGRSLGGFVADGEPGVQDWRTEAHWQWDFSDPLNQRPEQLFGLTSPACTLDVLRGARWKYVQFAGLAPLLFDLVEDPYQLVDRAGDLTCAPVVAECAQRLLAWRMRHADRTLTGLKVTRRGLGGSSDPRAG
jgi:arylsulfatase A-like enzyme